jgi:hypothetical protein
MQDDEGSPNAQMTKEQSEFSSVIRHSLDSFVIGHFSCICHFLDTQARHRSASSA